MCPTPQENNFPDVTPIIEFAKTIEDEKERKKYLTTKKSEFDKLLNQLLNPNITTRSQTTVIKKRKQRKNKKVNPKLHLVIHNIKTAENETVIKTTSKVREIFQTILKTEIKPKFARRMGKSKTVLIELEETSHRKIIYERCRKEDLYHQTKYIIEDYLTQNQQRLRRQKLEVLQRLKEQGRRQHIFIGNKKYIEPSPIHSFEKVEKTQQTSPRLTSHDDVNIIQQDPLLKQKTKRLAPKPPQQISKLSTSSNYSLTSTATLQSSHPTSTITEDSQSIKSNSSKSLLNRFNNIIKIK